MRGAFFINNNKDYNIKLNKNQYTNDIEILEDKTRYGKKRPWQEKKIKSLELCCSYNRLELNNKFLQVHQCGDFLEFKKFKDGGMRLNNANFCKARLCSMCSWRRELKIFSQVSKVINAVNENNNYRFLFLTLTCENVTGENLKGQLDILFKSFKRMFERKDVKKSIKGWFRALEITHDVEKTVTEDMYHGNKEKHLKSRKKYYDSLGLKVGDKNPNFDMYHPHFHIVLMVTNTYFSHNYLSQKKWTSLWQESLQCDYMPVVHIQPFKSNSGREVSEVSKYTVKDGDFLVKKDKNLTDRTVITLDTALSHRRLVAFGGLLKDKHKELNLSDVENKSDLVHIDKDGEILNSDLAYDIVRYQWCVGYSNYIKF